MTEERDRLPVDGTVYETEVPSAGLRPFTGMPDRREVRAFIPGTVVRVMVHRGEKVTPGSVLLLLDAMKMHNEVCPEIEGRVAEVLVADGDRVEKNQLLVRLDGI